MVERPKERFVAFAFSRSDLVFEIDRQGQVTFAAGSLKRLFGITIPITGSLFSNFIPAEFAAQRQDLLKRIEQGKRFPATAMDLAIAGCRVAGDVAGSPHPEHPGHYFLSFRAFTAAERKQQEPPAEAPPAPAALAGAAFADAATRLSKGPQGKKLSLTFIGIDGGAEKLDEVAPKERSTVEHSVTTMLRSFTADEAGVAQLAPDRFGVVHESHVSSELIREKISTLMQRVSPKLDCAVNTVALRPAKLSEEDAARAMVFAISKFATQAEGAFTIESLADVLDMRFNAAMGQITEFRSMVSAKKFELWYQPIVDVRTGQSHHQEALCRFGDGRSPFSTVVFAEEAGLITDLDYQVAIRAVDTLLQVPTAMDIAINVSGRSLETPMFITQLEAQMQRLNGKRSRLLVEITESSRINDMQKVNLVVERFRSLGHRVCIDDFGSGAAAFDYIRSINVDVVKIDGKFIKDLPKSVRDQTFVRAIHAMCSQLRCETVAEWVETAQHGNILKDIGIDHAQGYFYAKPSRNIGMRNAGAHVGESLRIA